jgi:hypothetical protein
MMHRIRQARARPDFTVEIEWDDGSRSVARFADVVGKGVAKPLADATYFVEKMTVGGGGDWLSWPDEVDFGADSLWYKAHPEDLRRDYGETDAAE